MLKKKLEDSHPAQDSTILLHDLLEKITSKEMVGDTNTKEIIRDLIKVLMKIIQDRQIAPLTQEELAKNITFIANRREADANAKEKLEGTIVKVLENLSLAPYSVFRAGCIKVIGTQIISVNATDDFDPVAEERKEKEKAAFYATKLIEILKEKYQVDQVAYIKGFYEARKLPIAESFVNLAIIQKKELKEKEASFAALNEFRDGRIRSFEDIYQFKRIIPLANLFDKEESQEPTKRILIDGRAGIGKTTLCNLIANCWSKEDKGKVGSQICQFAAVIWLPLRALRNFSNAQNLAHFIHQLYFREEKISIEQLRSVLFYLEEQHQILYLLDGYDEVADLYDDKEQNSQLSQRALLLHSLLCKEYWILTSRPYSGAAQVCFPDRHLENIGFVDKDIGEYIKRFFQDVKQPEIADRLLSYIKQNTNLKGIAHIPINLELICNLWKEEYHHTFSHPHLSLTRTSTYQQLTNLLTRRYLKERCQVNVSDLLPDEYETHPRCDKVLQFLEALAWQLMQQSALTFQPKTFSQLIKKYFPNPDERKVFNKDIYKHFGLLKGTGEETAWADQSYYFIHLTFQEFMAARYIMHHFEEEIESIRKYKYVPRYQMVWWFVAGLLSQNEDKIHLQTYFDVLLGEPETLREIDQLNLVWSCLNEAGLSEIKQQQELLERLDFYLANLQKYWEQTETQSAAGLPFTTNAILLNCLKFSENLRRHFRINNQLSNQVVSYLNVHGLDINKRAYEWLALVKGLLKVEKVLDPLWKNYLQEDIEIDFGLGYGSYSATVDKQSNQLKSQEPKTKLMDLMNNGDEFGQERALKELIQLEIANPVFLDRLKKWLLDEEKDTKVRLMSMEGLIQLDKNTESTVDLLLGVLKSKNEDKNIRKATITFLVVPWRGRPGIGIEDFNTLLDLLGDDDEEIQLAAVKGLVQIVKSGIGLGKEKDNKIQEAFMTLLKEKKLSNDLRLALIKGLIRLGMKAEDFISELKALINDKKESGYMREIAIEGLVQLEDNKEELIKTLMMLLPIKREEISNDENNEEEDSQLAAVKGLIKLAASLKTHQNFIEKTLITLLKDKDRAGSIREAAIEGLIALGVKDEDFINVLIGLLKGKDEESGYTQLAAIKGLVALRVERIDQILLGLLKNEVLQDAAAASLIQLGVKDRANVKILLDLLLDEDQYTQKAAGNVLIGLDIPKELWCDCLAQWDEKKWQALEATSLHPNPIPLCVLLQLPWSAQEEDIICKLIVNQLQYYIAYYYQGNLYYYQQQLEQISLTPQQFALLEFFVRKEISFSHSPPTLLQSNQDNKLPSSNYGSDPDNKEMTVISSNTYMTLPEQMVRSPTAWKDFENMFVVNYASFPKESEKLVMYITNGDIKQLKRFKRNSGGFRYEHVKNEEGNTLVHYAVFLGNKECVDTLTYRNTSNTSSVANHNAIRDNHYRIEPLHIAAYFGYFEVVQVLVKNDALRWRESYAYYVEIKFQGYKLRCLPLHLAILNGHIEVVDYLLKSIVDYSLETVTQRELFVPGLGNILHLAILTRNPWMLDKLIYHADLFKVNLFDKLTEQGKSLLSLAMDIGSNYIIYILTQHLLVKPLDGTKEAGMFKNIKLIQEKETRLIVRNLVFQGAGFQGIAYGGALTELGNLLNKQEGSINEVKRIAGVSTGVIMAMAMAVNLSMKEMKIGFDSWEKQLEELSLQDEEKHITELVSIIIKESYEIRKKLHVNEYTINYRRKIWENFRKLNGLYSTKKIFLKWIESMLGKVSDADLKFGDLAEKIKKGDPYKHLHVIVCRFKNDKNESNQLEVIDINSEDSQWKNTSIKDAICAALAIPGIFKPYVINRRNLENRWVTEEYCDGSILWPFPVKQFDKNSYLRGETKGDTNWQVFNEETVGFRLIKKPAGKQLKKDTASMQSLKKVDNSIRQLINTFYDIENLIANFENKSQYRFININCDIDTLGFGVGDVKKEELEKAGMQAVEQYLKNYNDLMSITESKESIQDSSYKAKTIEEKKKSSFSLHTIWKKLKKHSQKDSKNEEKKADEGKDYAIMDPKK